MNSTLGAASRRPSLIRTTFKSPSSRSATFRRELAVILCSSRPVAVITGASTGIGRVTAHTLAREGWEVYAGVRRDQDGQALLEEDCGSGAIRPLIIDVTNDVSVKAAVLKVAAEVGVRGVHGLINNAGKVTLAPVEFMPISVFEDQLQVNLVGTMRVTQAFLPLLREGLLPGRIINMSSMAGSVALPMFCGYNASKFGMEALSDCLRHELHSQGIKVVSIKPGAAKTPIWAKGKVSSDAVQDMMPAEAEKLYGKLMGKILELTRESEDNGFAPQVVADVVLKALMADSPQTRYLVGQTSFVQVWARHLLPDTIWDRLINVKMGQ